MRRPVAIATLAAAMVAGPVFSLPAQNRPGRVTVPSPLTVVGLSNLRFGSLLPGIPSNVHVLEPQAALFQIDGPADASVRLELLLPPVLVATGGATLPLRFGSGDGFVDVNRGIPHVGSAFDPQLPVITTLRSAGRIYVRIGGTALPARIQTGGEYRGVIVLTVYDLGS